MPRTGPGRPAHAPPHVRGPWGLRRARGSPGSPVARVGPNSLAQASNTEMVEKGGGGEAKLDGDMDWVGI